LADLLQAKAPVGVTEAFERKVLQSR
jgi:hypothetical protein